jgi:hypothetical protein
MTNTHLQTLNEIWSHVFFHHPEAKSLALKLLINQSTPEAVLSEVDLDSIFPMYTPKSGGTREARALETLKAINQVFERIHQISELFLPKVTPTFVLETTFTNPNQVRRSDQLRQLLNGYSSDKAYTHSYHHFYANIFESTENVLNILEVGIGTNNLDVLSTMGPNGKPGASLRAFRDFFLNANVVGCDVDKRILFKEERIETFWVDQVNVNGFNEIPAETTFDLMIDDGLHSPHANLNTLRYFISKIRVGGWIVIEDIGPQTLVIWMLCSKIIGERFNSHIFRSSKTGSTIFAALRTA